MGFIPMDTKLDITTLLATTCTIAAMGGAMHGYSEGVKRRDCPRQLEDGRQLVRFTLDGQECHYEIPKTPIAATSSEELLRIVAARRRIALQEAKMIAQLKKGS